MDENEKRVNVFLYKNIENVKERKENRGKKKRETKRREERTKKLPLPLQPLSRRQRTMRMEMFRKVLAQTPLREHGNPLKRDVGRGEVAGTVIVTKSFEPQLLRTDMASAMKMSLP